MSEHCEKIAFVWDESGPRIQVPDRLTFMPSNTVDFEVLVSLVARVMSDSLDRSDRKATKDVGAMQAATTFLDEVIEAFEYQSKWWQVTFDSEGQLVGFVLPVLFRGAKKDGLGGGTFYYMGVAPEYRGNNYVYDLLCRGTALLQEVGVWRIYSDTDVLNAPMIKAFQDVGYKQFGSPKRADSGSTPFLVVVGVVAGLLRRTHRERVQPKCRWCVLKSLS